FEGIHGFVEGQSRDVIGHHSEQFTPFLVALGLFVLTSNLFGIIPGLESPTGVPVVPLGCALCAFVYYHAHGFRHAGVGYLKHFLGPSDSTIPMYIRIPLGLLMLVIEPISHLARIMSVSIRFLRYLVACCKVIFGFLYMLVL